MKKVLLFGLLAVSFGATCWASDPVEGPALAAVGRPSVEQRFGDAFIIGGARPKTLLQFVRGEVAFGQDKSCLGTPVDSVGSVIAPSVRYRISQSLVDLEVEPKICLSVLDRVGKGVYRRSELCYVFWDERKEEFFVFDECGKYFSTDFHFDSYIINIINWFQFQPKTILEQLDILFNSGERSDGIDVVHSSAHPIANILTHGGISTVAQDKLVFSVYELFPKDLRDETADFAQKFLKTMAQIMRKARFTPNCCFSLMDGGSRYYVFCGRDFFGRSYFVFDDKGRLVEDGFDFTNWQEKVVAWTCEGGKTIVEQLAFDPYADDSLSAPLRRG